MLFVACSSHEESFEDEMVPPAAQTPASQDESTSPDKADGHGGAVPASSGIALPSSFEERLVDVVESKCYTPETFAVAVSESHTMRSFLAFGGVDSPLLEMLQPLFNLAVNSRLPQTDELFRQRVGVDENGQRQWQIERHVFTYHSVSASTGADTVLLGAVTFPNNMLPNVGHEVGTLTLHNHQAAFDYESLPSQSFSWMTLHALHNSAVIEPDLVGLEDDYQKEIFDYLNGDVLGLQMLHCVMAALDVMRQHGVALASDGYSNNWGSSLGLSSALGFTYYMENEAPEDVVNTLKLRSTFVGEGITKIEQLIGPGGLVSPPYKHTEGWHARLPLYVAYSPNTNFGSYEEMKEFFRQVATRPDGTVNPDVKWIPFNVANTEFQQLAGGNHFVAATLMLLYMSCAEEPADMVKYLQ